MTFADWVAESAQRYQQQDPATATQRSLVKLFAGANRRTIDRWVGDVWWDRSDWDILVVLDGMRVDVAQEVFGQDNVRSRWSSASTSIDWIQRHFDDQYRSHWRGTAYVTANPFADHDTADAQSADLGEKPLGHFDPVYKRAWAKEPVGTTPPEAVTDAAIDAWRQEDAERMIVHYMQPHQPFRSRPDWEHVYSNLENLTTGVNQGGPDIWLRCRDGEIDAEELWAAYRDNVQWVWDDVQNRLLENVEGDVVLSADHGNGMGEFGAWSHHGGQLAPSVRKVPVIGPIEATDHETITSTAADEQDEWNANEQLDALGYR